MHPTNLSVCYNNCSLIIGNTKKLYSNILQNIKKMEEVVMKNFKWYAIGILIIVIVAIAAGYYYYSTTIAPSTEKFKIAFIHTGSRESEYYSWHLVGIERLVNESPDEYELVVEEEVPVADFDRVAGEYADQGFNFICGVTADYMTVLAELAEKYPDTYFATASGWMFDDNLASYTCWAHEPMYLEGIIGAMLTETDKIGYLGGFPYPLPVCMSNGYIQGAQSVNPDIEITISYAGTWIDIAKGYEIGESQIESGVDFITMSCDGVGLGYIQAAKDNDVNCCGVFVDMIDLAPDNLITNCMFDTYPIFKEMINDMKAGTFEGKSYDGTFSDGAVYLSEFHQELPQEVLDAVETARNGILDGTINVIFEIEDELPHN
jgi:basic membrane protein A